MMGKDPITGEPVARDAESLLGAFLTFIGEDELWATMQKTKAVARAFAWFTGAVAALKGFVNEIPALFTEALKSLDVADIILIPRAFLKLAGVFGDFAVRFVNWGGNAVWTLLEIIFDVVSPGALVYIKKTGAALRRILRDPLPFVGNLVMVAKKAIPKLISLFIPGAGFISAILSIYDTIMVFVNKIKQIVQVVSSFVDSIAAIAEGQIDAAAERVESALAGALSLAINFLAGFVGLGKGASKVMGVIDKIRKPI